MRGKLNLISLIAGFVLHLLDVGFDIYVAIQYFIRGEWWLGALTLVFILLPVIITILASIFMRDAYCWGVVKLMVEVTSSFVLAIRDWKEENWYIKPCGSNYWHCPCGPCKLFCERKMKSVDSTHDLAFIRLLETLTESAPQWCLQIYVMLRQWYFPWYTIFSTIFSFLSLVFGITTHEKAMKTHDWYKVKGKHKNYPTAFKSYVTFFAWQFCGLLSRLPALVIFAYVFRYYVFVVLGVHLVVFLMASYFRRNVVSELFHNDDHSKVFADLLVASFSTMFHISGSVLEFAIGKDSKHHKMVIILYHVVISLENIALASLAIWLAPAGTAHMEDLKIIVLIFVFLGILSATMFMTLYYRCCHPSKLAQGIEENNTDELVQQREEHEIEEPLNP